MGESSRKCNIHIKGKNSVVRLTLGGVMIATTTRLSLGGVLNYPGSLGRVPRPRGGLCYWGQLIPERSVK